MTELEKVAAKIAAQTWGGRWVLVSPPTSPDDDADAASEPMPAPPNIAERRQT